MQIDTNHEIFRTGFTIRRSKSNVMFLNSVLSSDDELWRKDKTNSNKSVEQLQYLYVRVVKARDMGLFGEVKLVAEVKLGNYSETTKPTPQIMRYAEWNKVFAFSRECIVSSTVQIIVKETNEEEEDKIIEEEEDAITEEEEDQEIIEEDHEEKILEEEEEESYMGRISFSLSDIRVRAAADEEMAPKWYGMEDKNGDKGKRNGKIMVSIWFGTQEDEAFEEAWNSKTAENVPSDKLSLIKSKIYDSPKLWYLRVSVIEAEHIMPAHKGADKVRFPQFYAKVQVGSQNWKTVVATSSGTRSFSSPYWNEEFLFVVEEEGFLNNSLLVSVEDLLEPWTSEVVCKVEVPIDTIEKRVDERVVASQWFSLESLFGKEATRYVPRVHLRLSLDGGYHVFDEMTTYSSDVRPSDTTLWKPQIGVLEIRILRASCLMKKTTKDGRTLATNAYCVAKYGQKWCRTRTVIDSLSPEWNEQYNWEVYDLSTVVTVAVFDNYRFFGKNTKHAGIADKSFGKITIGVSTLENDRLYTQSYPLLIVVPSGVKNMGEIYLSIKLSCSNVTTMLLRYAMPLLPKMHYVHLLTETQVYHLKLEAIRLLELRLRKEEPPLGWEVVSYMLQDSEKWSLRRSKGNFFRAVHAMDRVIATGKFLKAIQEWEKPLYSITFLIIFIALVLFPEFIIPAIIFIVAFMGLRGYYYLRPQHYPPSGIDQLGADQMNLDEFYEEFDPFPTICPDNVIRMRYDRLRTIAARVQTLMGDTAVQLERFHALISWTDPRATFLFLVLCLLAAVISYLVPLRVLIALFGMYSLRPPWFRSKLRSSMINFFTRLPTAEGCSERNPVAWGELLVLIVCLQCGSENVKLV
ncbi:FT-interacting protein 3 isoform X1 [Arachis hypogaea]|uniref:C2 domain-containing protein n=2 Tax=Arachis hypogaea TaxID=3818 RepID=A0A445D907_ARAHY|nr:Multiple C2 and transmembrane domain-containing protein [Arachis hypogaea]RYR59650.1 hypothetical protein Ahy_A05g025561 [Arachis hypogaea]